MTYTNVLEAGVCSWWFFVVFLLKRGKVYEQFDEHV